VERFEIDFFICDENISVDAVEREYLSCEDVGFLQQRFFGYAVDFAHVEGFLIEFLYDHLIDGFLKEIVVLFLGTGVQEGYPLLKIFHVFVGWKNA
jgi:hypothetical protein